MIVRRIRLFQFRNYESAEVKLSEKTNIFAGENAQGKTNLLESLLYVSTTRSFRTAEDMHLIRKEESAARITLDIDDNGVESELIAMITREGKHLFVQKEPVKKTSQFLGRLNAVLFSPSDFEMFEGAPRLRRRFMDMEISKVNPAYANLLNSYNKLLKERNTFLKQNDVEDAYLDILTDQLVGYSLRIARQRRQFVSVINSYLEENYRMIAGEKRNVSIRYFSIVDENEDSRSLKEKYRKFYEKDIFNKQTSIGVHKDDIGFWIDQNEANAFASQGQKRMILLAVKLSLIGYIRRQVHKDPVLLLDDVLSELDEKRQNNLLSAIPESIQTVITTTSVDKIKTRLKAGTRIFTIEQGKITSVREVEK